MLKEKNSYTTFSITFIGLIGFHIFLFFPGLMSVDSISIYSEALKNSYSLHHPPFMGFTWHYLDKIHKGPALMFLFNMGLLWSAIYLLSFKIFKDKYIRSFCLLIPFVPHFLVYSGWVWKDIIFTYGYALISVYLALKTIKKEQLNLNHLICIFLALIYFTEVKYQARFILPIVLFWALQNYFKGKMVKSIIGTVLIHILVMGMIGKLDSMLIKNKEDTRNHSWQCVKIFDLAGMGIHSKKILMPRCLWKKKNITIDDVKRKYELAWEPLVIYDDSPFRKAETEEDRRKLLETWKKAVMDYPQEYIKHRFHIWFNGLMITGPGSLWLERKLDRYPHLKKYASAFSNLLAYGLILPIQLFIIIHTFFALRKKDKKPYAVPVLYLNLMSLALLAVLFVFSLAAVPRYVYFSSVFFILSIPFYLKIIKK